MSGFEFCAWLRAQADGARPYVLVATASPDPADLRAILQRGADDYLAKPYDTGLFDVRLAIAEQAIANRAVRKQLEHDLEREREHLAYLAAHDALTKLGNRPQFSAAVEAAVAEAADGGAPGALLYIDLDDFKIVNESLGHAAGDRLLVQFAYLLRNAARAGDLIARFAGNTFVVLQRGITIGEARNGAERIRAQVNDWIFCDSGKTFEISVSIGVAELTGEVTAEHVLGMADAACYSAKARGRNRLEVYQPDDGELLQLRHDARWATQIKHALKNNGIEIWFQPVVDLETNRTAFFETHARLHTSDGDTVEPEIFRGAAERFRLQAAIERRVLRLALRQLSANAELRLAVQLTAQTVRDFGTAEWIRRSFENAGVAPNRVTFEIAETAVVSNLEAATSLMERLRREGFRFALDDFGAGFSTFSYLKDLPIDYLKINGGFVRELAAEPVNLAFVKAINGIAQHLRIASVADGVERAETLKTLRKIGVRYAQGVFFNAPMPAFERPRDKREVAPMAA
jgi:diguanylate cyclase (GGDEF)-like protein